MSEANDVMQQIALAAWRERSVYHLQSWNGKRFLELRGWEHHQGRWKSPYNHKILSIGGALKCEREVARRVVEKALGHAGYSIRRAYNRMSDVELKKLADGYVPDESFEWEKDHGSVRDSSQAQNDVGKEQKSVCGQDA